MQKQLLIFLVVFNVVLISPFFYYFLKNKIYTYLKKMALAAVFSFGFLITLIGDIGAGKSSGMSALTHAFTVKMQQDIYNLMYEIKTIFKSLDFNSIDDFLFDYFTSNEIEHKLDQATKLVIENFSIEQTIIYNFMNHMTTYEYIQDYVYAFYVLYIRNNYVYSVTSIYNRITGNLNMKFDIEWQNIYIAYEKRIMVLKIMLLN